MKKHTKDPHRRARRMLSMQRDQLDRRIVMVSDEVNTSQRVLAALFEDRRKINMKLAELL